MAQPDPAEVQRAVQLHFSGQLDEAERMYRSLLSRFPDDPNCTHLLGMALHARGQNAAAEPFLVRALQLAPQVADFHNNYALFCSAIGRQDVAIEHLKRAIELNPAGAAVGYENMGMVLELTNRPEEAAASYTKALDLEPNRVKSNTRRGWTFWRRGRVAEALEHWERSVQLDPKDPDVHDGLCVVLAHLRRIDEAILHGQQSVQYQPDNPDAWVNLGGALGLQSRYEEAMQCVQRAIQIAPNYVGAIANLAWLKKQTGDVAASVELCHQALQIDPNSVQVLNQLAHSLLVTGNLDGSLQASARALQIAPNFVPAWVNYGSAQLEAGDASQAAEAGRRAIAIQPDCVVAHSSLLLLSLNFDPDLDPKAVYDEHRKFEVIHVTSQGLKRLMPQVDRNPDRPLRIGYVSPDFRRHAVASFIEPVLRTHDRSQFEIYCYSDVSQPDEITRRLMGYASSWQTTSDLIADELAERIVDNRIDILVDLAGHTADGRPLTFARKPAPVQISYLGYLNTTGLEAMDYRITDSIADPPGTTESLYTEKLLRLPCFFCYQAPSDAPAVGPLPADSKGHITFGSLNQPAKFNPKVIELWARLLKELPDSHLILNANAPGIAERRLIEMLAAHGIPRERFELVFRRQAADYFQTYNRIDIALDPFPFSGHTTSCDALWMGVPVVTMAGKVYASRTCASVLTHLGLEALVTAAPDDYMKAAMGLAKERAGLSDLRASIRDRMSQSTIANAAEFTGNLERTYRQAWREWCGLSGT